MTETSQTPEKKSGEWVKTIVAMAIGGAAFYSYANWDTVSVSLLGPTAYTCSNLVPEVVKISAENANVFTLKVIGMIDPVQVSKTDTRLECSGSGMLSNGTKTPILYRAYEEGGQWWITYNG